MTALQAPVIIVGMHRSGTSMVTRLLERLGLFVGWRKQRDHEALFFLGLNEWLLSQCGGAWDHPEPIRHLIGNPDARALVTDYLAVSLRSPRSVSFLGPGRFLRYRSPMALPAPWGFKDPRTTFTLPIWLDLFPEARVVYVCRHGVDVAASLKARQEALLRRRRERYRRLRPTYRIRPKQVGFTVGLRCATLGEGLELWEAYMRAGRGALLERGDRGLEVRYEDMLADPAVVLERLGSFCGLAPTPERCGELVRDIRPDRAFAYRSEPEQVDFAESVKDRLAAFGY